MSRETNLRQRKIMRARGLRQRWLLNTVTPIFVLVLTIVILCSAGISGYYYQGMRTGLEGRAQAAAESCQEQMSAQRGRGRPSGRILSYRKVPPPVNPTNC